MNKENTGKQNISIIFMQAVLPLCIYYLVNQSVVILGISVLGRRMHDLQSNSTKEMYLKTLVQMAGMFMAAFSVLPFYKRENRILQETGMIRKENGLSFKSSIIIVLLGAFFSLGLNFLFSFLGILQSSENYNQVAQRQFALPFWLAFLFYGMLSPWAEELMFRGIFYQVLKRNVAEMAAVFGSAIMFGAIHGNVVQMLYGSIMGVAMALLYKRYQNLLAPILFHGAANTAIYAITYFF